MGTQRVKRSERLHPSRRFYPQKKGGAVKEEGAVIVWGRGVNVRIGGGPATNRLVD